MKYSLLFLGSILFLGGSFIVIEHFKLNNSIFHGGVIRFGALELGSITPLGKGDTTFAPELVIPSSRFYIGVVQPNLWCAQEMCAPIGERIKKLGGWLQVENAKQPEIEGDFSLDESVKSIVVIADKDSHLVGIYPEKTIKDVENILDVHDDLWK